MIQPSDALLGLCASIITEILKIVPALRTNTLVTSIVAIVVVALGTLVTSGQFTWVSFLNSLAAAFLSYKIVVQPVATASGIKTQN